MNEVYVRGGKKIQRDIVDRAVHWCIRELMPRVRTLEIEVKLTKCPSAYGWCLMTDDHKTFEIELRKSLSLYDLVSTICHEMVHVKQYYRKELTEDRRWKTRKVSERVDYFDEPWEKEAFRKEKSLALKCFEEIEVFF